MDELIYFNGYGRAECIRMLLTHAKREFVDKRVEMEEFVKLKPSLPAGSLPVFKQAGGTVLY